MRHAHHSTTREHRLLHAGEVPELARPPEATPQGSPDGDGAARRELHQQTQRLVRHMQELRKTIAGARLNDLLQRQADDVERAMRDLLDAQAGRERAANERIAAGLTRVYDAVAAAEQTVLAAEQSRANPLRFREERGPDGATTFVFEVEGTDLNNRGPNVAITGELRWQERSRSLVRRGRGYAEVLGEWQPRRQDYSDSIDAYFRPGETAGRQIAQGARLSASREVRDGRTVYRFTTPPYFTGAIHAYTSHGEAHLGSSDAVAPPPAAPSVTVDRDLRERVREEAEGERNARVERFLERMEANAQASEQAREALAATGGPEAQRRYATLLNDEISAIDDAADLWRDEEHNDARSRTEARRAVVVAERTRIEHQQNLPEQARSALDAVRSHIEQGHGAEGEETRSALARLNALLEQLSPDGTRAALVADLGLVGDGLVVADRNNNNRAYRIVHRDGAVRVEEAAAAPAARGELAMRGLQDVLGGQNPNAVSEAQIQELIDEVNRSFIPALRERFGEGYAAHLPFTRLGVHGRERLQVRFAGGRFELVDTSQELLQRADGAWNALYSQASIPQADVATALQAAADDGLNRVLAQMAPAAREQFGRQRGLVPGVERRMLATGATLIFALRNGRVLVSEASEERDRARAEAVRQGAAEARRLAAETQPLSQVQDQVRRVNEALEALSPRAYAAATAELRAAFGEGRTYANATTDDSYSVTLSVDAEGRLRETHDPMMPVAELATRALTLVRRAPDGLGAAERRILMGRVAPRVDEINALLPQVADRRSAVAAWLAARLGWDNRISNADHSATVRFTLGEDGVLRADDVTGANETRLEERIDDLQRRFTGVLNRLRRGAPPAQVEPDLVAINQGIIETAGGDPALLLRIAEALELDGGRTRTARGVVFDLGNGVIRWRR